MLLLSIIAALTTHLVVNRVIHLYPGFWGAIPALTVDVIRITTALEGHQDRKELLNETWIKATCKDSQAGASHLVVHRIRTTTTINATTNATTNATINVPDLMHSPVVLVLSLVLVMICSQTIEHPKDPKVV